MTIFFVRDRINQLEQELNTLWLLLPALLMVSLPMASFICSQIYTLQIGLSKSASSQSRSGWHALWLMRQLSKNSSICCNMSQAKNAQTDGVGVGPLRTYVVAFTAKNLARLVTFDSFKALLKAGGEMMKDIVVASQSGNGQ
jgi:hypothetical protein